MSGPPLRPRTRAVLAIYAKDRGWPQEGGKAMDGEVFAAERDLLESMGLLGYGPQPKRKRFGITRAGLEALGIVVPINFRVGARGAT